MLKGLARKQEQQEEGRGSRTPALLAAHTGLVRRLGRASRGYVLAGVGVVAAAVIAVSLLSWLAPDSDRPVGHPLEVVVEQVVALIGADEEAVPSSVREAAAAAGSRIPWAGERLRQIATDRSASAGPAPVPTAARPMPNTAARVAQSRLPSPTTNDAVAPQARREPSPPIGTSSSPSSSTSETAPPAAEEEPAPTMSEPAPPPPPATEAPSPAAGEPPVAENPSTTPPVEKPLPGAKEPPPTTDEPAAPPATEEPSPVPVVEEPPPPLTDQPTLPPSEGPPPATNQPSPPTKQPPPIITQPPPPLPPPPPPSGRTGL
jgi:hypothetical protein